MDINLDVGGYKLNIRAAGLIKHNNKVLFHKNSNKPHYCLPGGRVEIGEDSEETVKRELQEELGKEVEIIKTIAIIENFFEMKGYNYHEIYFIHQAEFISDEDKKIEYTLQNVEGRDFMKYEWIEIDKLEEYNILPMCLKKMLKENKFPIHKINDELK